MCLFPGLSQRLSSGLSLGLSNCLCPGPSLNIIMMHNGLIVKFISFIIEITFIMHLIAEVNRLVKSNLVSLEVFYL